MSEKKQEEKIKDEMFNLSLTPDEARAAYDSVMATLQVNKDSIENLQGAIIEPHMQASYFKVAEKIAKQLDHHNKMKSLGGRNEIVMV